jgi:hypothetical protein
VPFQFRKVAARGYGVLRGVALAFPLAVFVVGLFAFEVVFDVVFDVVLVVFVVVAGVLTGAGVETVVLAFVLFAFALEVLVFAASPQAIPSAPRPITAESTITFFMLFKDSYLSQRIKYLFPGPPADRTQP